MRLHTKTPTDLKNKISHSIIFLVLTISFTVFWTFLAIFNNAFIARLHNNGESVNTSTIITTTGGTTINTLLSNSRIKFISTGGMFDYQPGNSAAVVQLDSGRALIDCGYTVFGALSEKAVINDIDYLLLTHLHGDHAGGLHPAILHWANKRKSNIKIIYPSDTFKAEIENYLKIFLVDVEKFVEFVPISDLPEIGCLDTRDLHTKGMQSYAYYFNFPKEFIYFSGDLGDLEFSRRFLKSVTSNNIRVFHEVNFLQGNAHVYYKDLETLSEDFMIFAYHCNSQNAPADCTLKFVDGYSELLL